jgi:hypothetical protein
LSKLKDPTRSGRREEENFAELFLGDDGGTMMDSRGEAVVGGGGTLVDEDTTAGSSVATGESSVRELATPPAASSAAEVDVDDRFFLDDMNDLVLTLLSKFIVVVSTISRVTTLSMKLLANIWRFELNVQSQWWSMHDASMSWW